MFGLDPAWSFFIRPTALISLQNDSQLRLGLVIVIAISEFLEHHSENHTRAPAYSRAPEASSTCIVWCILNASWSK